jgi:hypothetical protein
MNKSINEDGEKMPITIQPTTLRYKNGNIFQSVDCLKGDKGDPGDPSSLIDDEAGIGDTDKVVSADKHATDKAALLNAINVLKPAATASDVGKFLKVKTVADGVPTSFEYGEGGSGGNVIDDAAGAGVTNKTWSADKLTTMLGDIETLLAAI